MWTPDGIESLIEITAPTVIEVQRTKAIRKPYTGTSLAGKIGSRDI
jgi:hypothetical protein